MPVEAVERAEFESWCLIKSVQETEDGWLVSGPIVDIDHKDYDGDTLRKSHVLQGLSMFFKLGSHVDWDHLYPKTHDPKYLVGKGVDCTEVDGVPWLTTRLYKSSEIAQNFVAKLREGARFGYSIFGKAFRDRAGAILGTEIHYVTISPTPKGFGQHLIMGSAPGSPLAIAKAIVDGESIDGLTEWAEIETVKALETGNDIVQPGDAGGAALRTQNLRDKTSTTTYGGRRKRKRKKRPLVKALETAGCKQPTVVAAIVAAHLKAHRAPVGGR